MKSSPFLAKSTKLLSKTIPTYLGVLSLLILLVLLGLINQRLTLGSKAAVGVAPEEVRITNITSNTFVVTWKTGKPSSGMVKTFLSEEKLSSDVRDLQKNSRDEYYVHYVLVDGLLANETHYFWINSNGRFYGSDGKIEGNKFSAKTASIEANVALDAKLAYGQVIDSQENPVENALVYLNIPQVSPLSGLTSSSGYWVVPLAFAFNSELTGVADYQEGEIREEIVVDAGLLGRSQVVNFTNNNKPVPLITIGQDTDFCQSNNGSSNDQENGAGQGGYLPPYDGEGGKEKEFKLLNPEEGEGIATSKPEIFGTGPQGGTIEIIIESPVVFRGEVFIDSNGEWRWSPPGNLSPGEHTVTVKLKDKGGESKSYIRKFTVLAAEGDTAFTSTPSGDMASPTPMSIPTSTPAPLPTTVLTPTSTPGVVLTPTPTPTGIPQTGSFMPLMSILLVGGIILATGMVFIVLP